MMVVLALVALAMSSLEETIPSAVALTAVWLPHLTPCLQPLQTATVTRQQFTSSISLRRLLICNTRNSLRPPSVVLPCRRQPLERPIPSITTITALRTLNRIKTSCFRLEFPSVDLKGIIRPLAALLKRSATSLESTMSRNREG